MEEMKNDNCDIYRKSGNVYIVGCDCQFYLHTSEWDSELGTEYHYCKCLKYGYYWEGII